MDGLVRWYRLWRRAARGNEGKSGGMSATMPETPGGRRRISRSGMMSLVIIAAGAIGAIVYLSPDHPLRFLTQLAFLYGMFFFALLVPIKLISDLGGRYPRMRHSYGLRLLVVGPVLAVPLAVYTLTILVFPGLRDDHGIGTTAVTIYGGVSVVVALIGALILTGQTVWRTMRRRTGADRSESHAGN
jgi:hypothetical protein